MFVGYSVVCYWIIMICGCCIKCVDVGDFIGFRWYLRWSGGVFEGGEWGEKRWNLVGKRGCCGYSYGILMFGVF